MKGKIFAFFLCLWLIFVGGVILASEKPTGVAIGRVTTREGLPLKNARVLFSGPSRKVVRTNADGSFRAERLVVGRYMVQARARGFDSQWITPTVLVKEGEVSKDLSFNLMKRNPALYFANYQRVYTPAEPLRIGMRGTLIDRVELTLYRLDLKKMMLEGKRDGLDGLDHRLPERFPTGALSLEKRWSRPIRNADEDDWFYQSIVPDLGRENGTFLLVAEGYAQKKPVKADAYWFNRTDLALVAKRSSSQLLLYATDLVTKQPVENVDFEVYGSKKLFSGKTGKDGLFLTPFAGEDRVSILAARRGKDGSSFAVLSSYHYADTQRDKVYAYTDRPVYRPDQSVFFRGIASSVRPHGGAFLKSFPVRIRIKDPSDAVLYDKTLTTDAFGAFHDRLNLSEEASLGEYSIEAIAGKNSDYSRFQVQEYRKPEYRIEVSSDRKDYLAGETIQATVDASYYFGAPVSGSKVNYTVYSTPVYGQAESDDSRFYFDFLDSNAYSWGYGDVVSQGEAVTDAEGKIHLAVPTKRIEATQPFEQTYDQRYTLDVEAVDSSRRPVKAKGSFLVSRGLFALSASLEQSVVAPNQPVRLNVRATDRNGRPLSEKNIAITAFEQRETPGEGETRIDYLPLFTKKGLTENGGLSEELKFTKQGQYGILVSAKDERGNTVSEQAWLWVASGEGAGFGSSVRTGSMRLIFDKQVYKSGDRAKVILSAPVGNVPVLLTREASSIEDARVIRLNSPNKLIEIPITREFEPNVFLGAVLVNGKEFHQVEKSLNVSPEENFLKVRIEPEKKKYGPGEQAKVRVKINDAAGKPVEAECSLGVVDEAIYAIQPDLTPDIRRFFLGPRYHDVSTNYSFPEEYSGGLSKESGDSRVREKFEDTALWLPELKTDRNGVAEASFVLPDNLTTWVVTVRANTRQGKVGSATSTFLVSKDLLVRLIAPRFLTQGDRLSLAAITHNRTQKALDLALSLKAENLSVLDPARTSLSLKPEGSGRAEWQAEARNPGLTSLTVSARGKGVGDAMKIAFPVLPHGIERIEDRTGILATQSVLSFALPQSAENGHLYLEFNPTPLPAVLGALDYLKDYPYGCTEQTTSRFLPELTTLRTLGKLGIKQPENQSKVQLAKALKRLYAFQQSDGGWAWWEHGDSEPELTAYALLGLDAARKSGLEIDPRAVKGGLRYLADFTKKLKPDLSRRFTLERGTGYDAAAFGLYSVSLFEATPESKLEALFRKREGLSNYGRALLALAFVESGRKERANELLASLSPSLASPGLNHWRSEAVPYSWFDGDVEATAWILQATLAVHPQDPNVLPTVRWLLAQKSGKAWDSTKETAAVVLALDQAMRVSPPSPSGTRIVASLDGRESLFEGDRLAKEFALHPGANRLVLAREGSGTIPYCLRSSYFEKKASIPAFPRSELKLARTYHLLSREIWAKNRDLQGIENIEKVEAFRDLPRIEESVRSGDLVLVRLRINNSEPLRYLVVEDPLPGGAEVLDDSGESWGYWWNHREVRDEKVALFVSRLEPGVHDMYYVMRPELPGDYRVLPASIYPMYSPELRASTAGKRLKIEP